MPGHSMHRMVTRMLTGQDTTKTDRIVNPAKVYGANRRKHSHTLKDIVILSCLSKNPRKFIREAYMHSLIDRVFSKNKVYKRRRRKVKQRS